MMNIGKWSLDNRALVYFALLILTFGGMSAYLSMSKLEDPEIKVKQATVVTLYPGASSHEVELEVTDQLERSIRTMDAVKRVTSSSSADVSVITVEMSELLSNDEVEQSFEMLRRRVYDTQASLPSAASPSIVLDAMGNVFGMFYAMGYEGYTNEEAEQYADLIMRKLQLIRGVSEVRIYGVEGRSIFIDFDEERLSGIGLLPATILKTIQAQNTNIYSGYYDIDGQRMRVSVSDRYQTPEDIADLHIQTATGRQIRLGDIARVHEGRNEPVREMMRYDGRPALGIAISVRSGTDITAVGEEVERTLSEIEHERLPVGMHLSKVFYQPERVEASLSDFMMNLIASIVIVVVVLIFFMGWRSGVILGTGLLLTVVGSIVFLNLFDGTLQRVSLASFVLAMGMLVDNSIVVLDGIQLRIEQGQDRLRSLTEPGQATAMPLLGATLIAILSFLPLFLSPDTAGIYVRDLFIVLAVSLMLSWVLALVLNPIMADKMLRPKPESDRKTPYSGRFYEYLRQILAWILGHRITSMAVVMLLVATSIWGYRLLPQGFFPDMNYDQLYIEYKLPEGYTTDRIDRDLQEIESYLSSHPEVKHTTTAIGGTPARYNLVRSVTGSSLSYGELIVDFSSPEMAVASMDEIQSYLTEHYPDAQVRVKRYNLMYKEYPIEVEFRGPDPAVLRTLSEQALGIMQSNDKTLMARVNWFDRVPGIEVQYDQHKALRAGVSRQDIGMSLLTATDGLPVATFYDGRRPRSITVRTVDHDGRPIEGLENASIYTLLPNLSSLDVTDLQALMVGAKSGDDLLRELTTASPLSSLSDGFKLVWEEPVVMRTNGERSIKAQCSPRSGISTETLRADIADPIEAIKLPEGYSMYWEGEYGASGEATSYLFKYYPLAIVLMIALLIMLFGDYRKPLVVVLSLPVLAIGVVWGMYFSGKVFSFTAIVAVLGLVGMMIKNAIVLLDEVVLLVASGVDSYTALVQSAVSRVRPVMLASATTILGMLPLVPDPLFGPSAVVIMAGLTVAAIATILFVPLLYAVLHGVQRPKSSL